MSILRRLAFVLMPLAMLFFAAALVMLVLAVGRQPLAATVNGPEDALQQNEAASPLVAKVRAATERFKNINAALAAGFVQGTPCVSGPMWGAMGVHFVLPARIAGGILSADQPEALIYEPQPDGAFRLVGVEFIVLASIWASQHPDAAPPALEGQLLNLVDAPNRYGLPAFYEIHVWAWEHNPVGSFADWNTHVTCARQPAE
jgi:hypothetical protein